MYIYVQCFIAIHCYTKIFLPVGIISEGEEDTPSESGSDVSEEETDESSTSDSITPYIHPRGKDKHGM